MKLRRKAACSTRRFAAIRDAPPCSRSMSTTTSLTRSPIACNLQNESAAAHGLWMAHLMPHLGAELFEHAKLVLPSPAPLLSSALVQAQ